MKNPQRFGGLLTNMDVKDVPAGRMVTQTNIGNYRPGRLDVRKGVLQLATPWSLTVSGTDDVIAVFGFLAPQARWLVLEKTDGSVKAIRDGATQALITGLNAFQPISCVADPYGSLIVVNGIERGYRWNGQSGTPDALGVDGPIDLWGAGAAGTPAIDPSFLPGTGNLSNDVVYSCAYRYVDRDGIPSSISEIKDFRTEAGASGTKIQWIPGPLGGGEKIPDSTQGRVATGGKIEFWRSARNAPAILYKVHEELSGSGWTSFQDDVSDEDLLDSDPDDVLPIFTQDGLPNARRFEKPPTNKPYVALHQDVLLMYGRVFYNEGTLAATNGNATHTGTSTAVRSEMVGWKLRYVGETTEYEVATVNEGAQTFTTTVVYAGTTGSGKSYVLSPNPQSDAYNLRFSVKGEPESMPTTFGHRIQTSGALTDLETGLIPFGASVYIFHERTFYVCNYGTNPSFDLSFSPAHYRGLVNNRCAIIVEGQLWALDQLGPYSVTGGGADDGASFVLRNYFAERIDWGETKRKWYFASYDPHARVLRWHVQFVGDGNTRPKRALCRNTLTGEWWDELYPVELSGGAVIDVDGVQRLVCGGPDDNAMLMGEGTSDLITAAVQGTITSAVSGGTGLVDSTASFSAAVVGAPVSIIAGTGKGTTRTIASRTNGTTLVVSANWTVGTDSVYVIGAIAWSLKTGGYELLPPSQGADTAAVQVPRKMQLQHVPTTNENYVNVRFYYDRSESPIVGGMPGRDNTGFMKRLTTGDYEIKTKSTRGNAAGTDAGYTSIPLDGVTSDDAASRRLLQIGADGYQGPEQVTLAALDVLGAQ